MGKMAKALATAIDAHNLNTELVVYLQCKDKTPTRGLWNQGSRRGLSLLLTVLLQLKAPNTSSSLHRRTMSLRKFKAVLQSAETSKSLSVVFSFVGSSYQCG